eukprot:scaffold39496_cov77-Cyclotella_meneghiniana.AAC.5
MAPLTRQNQAWVSAQATTSVESFSRRPGHVCSYSSVMDEYNRRTFAVITSQDDTIHIHIIGFCNDGEIQSV